MEHIDEKVGLEEGIATMPDEKQCFRVSMECVCFIFITWREFSSGRPVSNLQAFQDSTTSMIVFKTEDMVETSAPHGTTPKRGTFFIL